MSLVLKVLISLFLIAFFVMIVGISYFIYTMTIGDTWRLLEKLENMENVLEVRDYWVYEGTASFSLILAGGGIITLGGIGNADLQNSDGMRVERVGNNKIHCYIENSTLGSIGITAKTIQSQFLPNTNLNSLPRLIDHYDELNALVNKMPLKYVEEKRAWICDIERK